MNKFLIFIFIICSISCVNIPIKNQFTVNKVIFQTQELTFLSHDSSAPYGRYLSMEIPYAPVQRLFAQIEQSNNEKLITRGEAHITVLTPPEFNQHAAGCYAGLGLD